MANIRKCATCGIEYDFCMNNSRNTGEIWRIAFHDETCRDLFDICSKYAGGALSAVDAKKALDKLNIPKVLADHIQANITKINVEASKSAKAPKAEAKAEAKAEEPKE